MGSGSLNLLAALTSALTAATPGADLLLLHKIPDSLLRFHNRGV